MPNMTLDDLKTAFEQVSTAPSPEAGSKIFLEKVVNNIKDLQPEELLD